MESGPLEDAHQCQAGQDTASVRQEVVPVAGAARAEELTQFQGGAQEEEEEQDHGRANAATEAAQTGEGGEDCIGGKVLDLVVDATLVNEVHYAALGGREAADDNGSEGSEPDQAEGESHPCRSSDKSRSKRSIVGTSPSFNGTAGCPPNFSVASDI